MIFVRGRVCVCVCVSQTYNYTHLSAGDLLRAERAREGSEFGQLIANYIKEGKIVPVEITINLLRKVCISYSGWRLHNKKVLTHLQQARHWIQKVFAALLVLMFTKHE